MRVAVIGAGPAGAFAAYELARRGARVTLFDPSHPREKPCGGGVTGRALELVSEPLGPRVFPRAAVRSARFIDTTTGDAAIVPLGADALVVASRTIFDAALFDAAVRAGATIRPSRVADFSIDDAGVTIRTATSGSASGPGPGPRSGPILGTPLDREPDRERFDFVIGADGANSLVRRRVMRPFRRDELSIAAGYFIRGITSDEIVLEMISDPPGYIWSFPRPDHLAVGICAQADEAIGAAALRTRTRHWILSSGIAPPDAHLESYSWPIPSLDASGFAGLTPAGPRWCLVGDAAGLVDPITREGIYFALASGMWAAEALASGNGASLRTYVSRVRDEAAPELACAARFKAAFFRRPFSGLLLGALRESAAIRAVMADLVAGTQSYRTLKWRLLQTFEVALAWRAITARNIRRAL